MFIKNDSEGRWVNGTIGTVTECLDKNKKCIKVKIGKKTHKVEREEWKKVKFTYNEDLDEVYEEVVSSFKQFPIKLGWAVTIHKAQGSQWDTVQVFAPDIFVAARMNRTEAGTQLWKRLAYVAITRAENRLIWVVRNRLARPSGALVVDDLTADVPNFELTMEPIEDQKDGAF